MRLIRPALLAVLALLVTSTVAAQTTQYTAPGSGRGETPTREEIETEMARARWRLGPFRISPWLGLRGLTYEDNVFVDDGKTQSDVHGSVGAGLSVFLPTGENVFWTVQALPEYLFWLDLDGRNRLIGRYGAGVLADLNRLRFSIDGQQSEQQGAVTSESAQQVLSDLTTVHAVAEVTLSSALRVAVDARQQRYAFELPDGSSRQGDLDFSDLDRDEQTLGAELRYVPNDKVELALGVETSEVDFAVGSRDLSSTGTSPYFTIGLDGNRFDLDAHVTRRQLDPRPGSLLRPVEATEGEVRVGFELSHRFTLRAFESRSTAYAISDAYTQFDEERHGVELGIAIGRRLDLRLFAEAGSDDYEPLPGALARRDDVLAWGFYANYKIGEWLSYRAGAHQVTYDSNLPGFDRDFVRLTSTLVLSTTDWVWQ